MVGGVVEFGFELGRRLVPERGVKALGVVDGIDEAADVTAGMGDDYGDDYGDTCNNPFTQWCTLIV